MNQTKELLTKQMTRKEFFQFAGMAILTLLGVSNFISLLLGQKQKTTGLTDSHQQSTGRGFGSSKFGA